jgi:hypothetical protein
MIFAQKDQRIWTPPLWWFNEGAQQGWQYEANRGELLEPVFRWNWSNREAYANAAQRSWNSRGWYVPETSSFDGPEPLPEGQTKPEGRRAQYLLSSYGGEFTARNTYNMAKFAALYYKKLPVHRRREVAQGKGLSRPACTAEFYCGLKAGFQAAGGMDKARKARSSSRRTTTENTTSTARCSTSTSGGAGTSSKTWRPSAASSRWRSSCRRNTASMPTSGPSGRRCSTTWRLM